MICLLGKCLFKSFARLIWLHFFFYGEEKEELLTYSRLKFLVRYLWRTLSVCILDPRSLWGAGERCWSFKEVVFERPECPSLRLFCLNAHPVALSWCLWSPSVLSFSLLYVWCMCAYTHVYVRVYTCVWGALSCANMWRPEVDTRCLLQLFLFLMFWDRISHWTWSLLFWLVWGAGKPQDGPVSTPQVTGLCQPWGYRLVPPHSGFIWMLEIWIQAPWPLQQVFYPLSPLVSPGSYI